MLTLYRPDSPVRYTELQPVPFDPHSEQQPQPLAYASEQFCPMPQGPAEYSGGDFHEAAESPSQAALPDSHLVQTACELLYCTLDRAQEWPPRILAGPCHLRPGHQMGRFYARPCGDNVYECPIYTADGPVSLRYFAHSQPEAFLLAMWLHPDCTGYLHGSGWPEAPSSEEEFLAGARDALARIRTVLAAHSAPAATVWTQAPPAVAAAAVSSSAALPSPAETPWKPPVIVRMVELLHGKDGVPSAPLIFKKLREEGYREFNNLTALNKALAPFRARLWDKATRANRMGRIDSVLQKVQATRPGGHTKKHWSAIIQKELGVNARVVRDYFSNRITFGHILSEPGSDNFVLDRQRFRYRQADQAGQPAAPAPSGRVTRSSTRRD